MSWNPVVRLIREDDGMELIEWSLVGVVFALACSLLWSSLNEDISSALNQIANCISDSSHCT